MSRVIEYPKTVTTGHESVTTHPAFGQIGAHRVSGGGVLYDSEFLHQHYVTISIRTSELHRTHNRDWHFGRDEIIEVSLSEAQWATFVSSMNMGSGVPCTIQHRDGGVVPGLPDPERTTEKFAQELRDKLKIAEAQVVAVQNALLAGSVNKTQAKALAARLEQVRYNIGSNAVFVADSFDEHMETTVEKAKIEINAYATNMVMRTGLNLLGQNTPIVQLIANQEKPHGES